MLFLVFERWLLFVYERWAAVTATVSIGAVAGGVAACGHPHRMATHTHPGGVQRIGRDTPLTVGRVTALTERGYYGARRLPQERVRHRSLPGVRRQQRQARGTNDGCSRGN